MKKKDVVKLVKDIIKEIKQDNIKLAKQIEDLEKDAKDMLLYP